MRSESPAVSLRPRAALSAALSALAALAPAATARALAATALAPAATALASALALASAGARAQAQERPAETGAAEALLERMDQKRFGAVVDAGQGTLRLHGHMLLEIPGRTSEQPLECDVDIGFDGARMSEVLDYGAQGVSTQVFDGKLFWGIHPVFGTRIYRGAEERTLERLYGIVRGAPWRSVYDAAEVVGAERQDGAVRSILRLWNGNAHDTWVVDASTLLPVRIELVMPECAPENPAKLEYSDWRPVGGILYPFVERFTMQGARGVTTYDAIERGVQIPADRFDTPAEIRELAAKQAADPKAGDGEPSMQVVEREEQAAASIRVTARADQVQRTFAALLPEVMAFLTETGASTAGPPFGRFHGEKDGQVDVEVGLPVAAALASRGRVGATTLPGGRTAIAWYSGPYSGLNAARARLAAALAEKALTPRGGPWVFYWTDPTLEPDPARRRTQIVQPIE